MGERVPVPREAPEGLSDEPIVFPRIARLELDELLSQLVERAQDVLGTQGRLEALLTATRAVSSDLSLPVVLRRIVEAACELLGTRYGALGVVGPDGLSEFLHVGMDPQVVQRIGHLPRGEGILGLLITDPRPLRLDDLTQHPGSTGFPPGHPPMRAFLGAPVRVRGTVFGNIYLADEDPRRFTAEDEELLQALAGTAAVAIENAQLFAAANRRARWIEQSAELSSRILRGTEAALPLLARAAREVAEADFAAVVLPAGEDGPDLRVVAADGDGSQGCVGRLVPGTGSWLGRALDEDRDLCLDAVPAPAGGQLAQDVPDGPAVVVRLRAPDGGRGVLALVRRHGRAPFAGDEPGMAAAFARQAEVALELLEAQRRARLLDLLGERERIGAELQESVVSRLFALGLELSSTEAQAADPHLRAQLASHVTTLDQTIRALRSSVFEEPSWDRRPASDWRAGVFDLLTELAPVLGEVPRLQVNGLGSTLPPGTADDLLSFLRAVLPPVAQVWPGAPVLVSIDREAAGLRLVVRVDAGRQAPTPPAAGTTRLRRTARGYGGVLQSSGTGVHEVVWTAPL